MRKILPFFEHLPLKEWFTAEKRVLPWRENPSPYKVWISEIMLQQTRAAVVVPYFERWLKRFPTVQALAQAPFEELLKLWEGLGYYSRVRHIHQAAHYLVKRHDGKVPSSAEELAKVKGIGPYTRGAILSFAFHKKAAAVDGNVLRVMARYFAVEEEIGRAKKRVAELVETILPEKEPWVVMEALIELGAQICQKNPQCDSCPLQRSCLAHLHRKTHLLPKRKKLPQITALHRSVLIIRCGKEVLVGRVAAKKVMADLYEFPYLERTGTASLKSQIKRELKLHAQFSKQLSPVAHSFTRFRATLYPSLWHVEKKLPAANFAWMPLAELSKFPFSSGHKRIIQELLHENIAH